ncbi:uncharacterized protein LOC133667184 [Apis cerana]|uniref:uncharacterized protein LOC133667184 n=1 Tax=Apis cerana TaxID=7461 RepID=UPI002B23D9E7|nr:uncharacterized protein LOC133667184 [Apis cerana]
MLLSKEFDYVYCPIYLIFDKSSSCENPFLNKYFEATLYSPITTDTSKILTVETILESLSEDSASHWSGTSLIRGKSGITSEPLHPCLFQKSRRTVGEKLNR